MLAWIVSKDPLLWRRILGVVQEARNRHIIRVSDKVNYFLRGKKTHKGPENSCGSVGTKAMLLYRIVWEIFCPRVTIYVGRNLRCRKRDGTRMMRRNAACLQCVCKLGFIQSGCCVLCTLVGDCYD